MLYYAILILVGGAVFILSSNLLALRERRWPALGNILPDARRRKKFHFYSEQALKPLFPFLKPVYNLPYLKKLQYKLEVLRINMNMGILIIFKLVMMIVAAGAVVALHKPLYIIPAAMIGFFVPDIILFKKIAAKREEIRKGFPEAIDLLDLCIGAGLDFTSSVRWVVEKTESNCFVEQLELVLSEIHVGKSQTQALRDMSKRLNLQDISSFVRAVVQAENMGTSLEEIFNNLSEDTRLARFQAGERYAIKASLKILFPLLFCILPVIMIVVAGPVIVKFTQGSLIPSGALK